MITWLSGNEVQGVPCVPSLAIDKVPQLAQCSVQQPLLPIKSLAAGFEGELFEPGERGCLRTAAQGLWCAAALLSYGCSRICRCAYPGQKPCWGL